LPWPTIPMDPAIWIPSEPICSKLHVIPAKNRPRAQAAWRAFLSRKPYGVAKFDSPAFRKAVTEALQQEDYPILWVHFMETLVYLPSDAEWKKSPLVVLDQHNADERFW
jgi:hypothetical protein